MSIIERLKNNKEAFGLMDEELRRVAEKIGACDNFLWYTGSAWHINDDNFDKYNVYQLTGDYQCKHPEHVDDSWPTHASRCAWCGAEIEPPKPEYGWVEYEVFKHYGNWVYDREELGCHLANSLGVIGFGGIRYKHPDGTNTDDFMMYPPKASDAGPWTPVSVRFWEVKK